MSQQKPYEVTTPFAVYGTPHPFPTLKHVIIPSSNPDAPTGQPYTVTSTEWDNGLLYGYTDAGQRVQFWDGSTLAWIAD